VPDQTQDADCDGQRTPADLDRLRRTNPEMARQYRCTDAQTANDPDRVARECNPNPSPSPTNTPTQAPTPRPTDPPTQEPSQEPTQEPSQAPVPTRTPDPVAAGAQAFAQRVANGYQWVKDCTAYHCGEAWIGALVSDLVNLGRRMYTTSAEQSQARVEEDEALRAKGIDPAAVQHPGDVVIDPENGITMDQYAWGATVATSPEARQLGAQLGIEAVSMAVGHVVGGLLDEAIALGRRAIGRAAAETIEQGLEQGEAQVPRLVPTILPRPGQAAPALRSAVGESNYAIRQAETMSVAAQRDTDHLLSEYAKGNTNPGMGNRSLGAGYVELRGRNNGRVILKQTGANQFDVVGKFETHRAGQNQDTEIMRRLIEEYEQRHP
jgi:hypothetical protein